MRTVGIAAIGKASSWRSDDSGALNECLSCTIQFVQVCSIQDFQPRTCYTIDIACILSVPLWVTNLTRISCENASLLTSSFPISPLSTPPTSFWCWIPLFPVFHKPFNTPHRLVRSLISYHFHAFISLCFEVLVCHSTSSILRFSLVNAEIGLTNPAGSRATTGVNAVAEHLRIIAMHYQVTEEPFETTISSLVLFHKQLHSFYYWKKNYYYCFYITI